MIGAHFILSLRKVFNEGGRKREGKEKKEDRRGREKGKERKDGVKRMKGTRCFLDGAVEISPAQYRALYGEDKNLLGYQIS